MQIWVLQNLVLTTKIQYAGQIREVIVFEEKAFYRYLSWTEQDAKILTLYLRMSTQEEIADKVGVTHQTVSNRLEKISKNKNFLDFSNPPKSWVLWNPWVFSP